MPFISNGQRWAMKTFLKNILGDFIEVLIHQIIYLKRIYPDCIYVKRRKFNTPVFMSKQPWVNDYITRAVEEIKNNISDKKARGAIASVGVIIARNGVGYQKFKLGMPLELKDVWYEDLGYKTHDFREKLEQLFSKTLLRLFEVVAGLKPEPEEEEREWWVVMTTAKRSGGRMVMKRSQEWCRLASSQYSKANKSLLPVMAFRDPLSFQLYIEADQQDAIINQQEAVMKENYEEKEEEEEEDLRKMREMVGKDGEEEENLILWGCEVLPQREDDLEIYADGKVPVMEVERDEDVFAEEQDTANNQMELVSSDEDMFAGYD